MVFGPWAEEWLATAVHLKPKTVAGYRSLLRSRILPAFGQRALGDIRPADVRVWLASMRAAGLSPSRCRQAVHLLGAVLTTAVDDGLLATSPCAGVRLPPLPQAEMPFLTPAELQRLLAAVAPAYRTFVAVLAFGGLPFGEAATLRRGRCRLDRSQVVVAESLADVSGTLHFGPPKTHQRRTVSVPGFVRDALAELVEPLPDDDALVFTSPRGTTIRYTNFARRVWRPALAGAGLPHVGVHALRHTCAALLVAEGAHPKAIQRHLGHRSITTTLDRYGHLFDDEHRRLAERLDAAFGWVWDPVGAPGRAPCEGPRRIGGVE